MAKPKPIFRVGQVVVWRGGGDPVKIRRRGTVEREKVPCYWVGSGGYVPENFLRPLTVHEIGPRRKGDSNEYT